jgi:chemotaxis protein methyltransferase CheR
MSVRFAGITPERERRKTFVSESTTGLCNADNRQAKCITVHLRDNDFKLFSEFIYKECGIKLSSKKKTMLEARLAKRLRALNIRDFKVYKDFVFSQEGMQQELVHLIDVVTTNTTSFFREPKHFELISKELLPAWYAKYGGSRPFRIWSAGCSEGMEPYTLAMVLSNFKEQHGDFKYTILATDISTRMLKKAVTGIYCGDRADSIPYEFKKKYLLRSKDRKKDLIRICSELQKTVCFERLNFMEQFRLEQKQDIIFCRNVIIYFDQHTQEQLLNKFCKQLCGGGHLFLGHSESINGLNVPLKQAAPTVYCMEESR